MATLRAKVCVGRASSLPQRSGFLQELVPFFKAQAGEFLERTNALPRGVRFKAPKTA